MKLQLSLAMIALAACSHATPSPTPAVAPPQPAALAPAPAPAPAPPPPPAAAAAPAPTAGDQLAAALPKDGLFFSFNSSELSSDAQTALAAVGPILAQHRELALRIEGNCDERGSREYNLALGQRRAEAAKKQLLRLGASEGQLTTVSYGRERPRASGHDEAAWSQNRRDDLVAAGHGGER